MKLTNKYNMPDSFLNIVNKLTYDITKKDPNRISVTSLYNPYRINYLMKKHWNELEEDVSCHLWRILGNAVHWVLSKAESNSSLSEEKLIETIDGITIVGKIDLYEDKTKSIEDYKITSLWSVKDGNEKEEWEIQLNLYAWMIRKVGFEVNKAYINAILKDWRKAELNKYNGYPPIPFKRLEIKLWSFDEQEAYVIKKVKEYKELLTTDNIPVCSSKDRWAKADVYAVYKNKNKTATRLLDSMEKANQYIEDLKDIKNKYNIVKREGLDMRCMNYCLCNKFCDYYINKYGGKDARK